MSDEEKSTYEIIDEIISRKMKPLYYIHGGTAIGVLAIFMTVAIDLKNEIDTFKKFVSEDFLTKGTYIILQRQSHESDIEAIRNPQNADIIYMKRNNADAEYFDFVSRGGIKNN